MSAIGRGVNLHLTSITIEKDERDLEVEYVLSVKYVVILHDLNLLCLSSI